MIHIVKEKKGFAVKSVADNGELLATSETLASKAMCWKNIRAMIKNYNREYFLNFFIYVQDDTWKIAALYYMNLKERTRTVTREFIRPKYEPGINHKKKKK